KLYLPHFGLVEGNLNSHFDALAERVERWANWFRDQIRARRSESELITDFAAYEAKDILKAGAPNERLADYEHADPSAMAVTASRRYWQKFHPDAIAYRARNGGLNPPRRLQSAVPCFLGADPLTSYASNRF